MHDCVAEDGSKDLGLGRILQALDLVFGFGWQVSLERLDVFLHASFHPPQQAYPVAILSVAVFFSHLNLFLRVGTAALGCPVERVRQFRPQDNGATPARKLPRH